jgi:hypothetical protein
LRRWTGELPTGPFSFADGGDGPTETLGLNADGEQMRDRDGRVFCSVAELAAVEDLGWRGCPGIVFERMDGVPMSAVWFDARGITAPEDFRRKLLRV